ncbi:MAG: CCC motif membrane protein [Vicingaceae bacterium]
MEENKEVSPQDQQNFNTQLQQNLPNATGVLVLGILSIVFCFCYGIPGLILGIIALVMSKKATALYNNSPNTYSESSFKNMKAGRICAIIGLCLSSLYAIVAIIYIAVIGAAIGGGLLQGLGSF